MKYHRPKTYKDLIDSIRKNIDCEVISSSVDTVNAAIAWCDFWEGEDYKTRDSENKDWSVYYSLTNQQVSTK